MNADIQTQGTAILKAAVASDGRGVGLKPDLGKTWRKALGNSPAGTGRVTELRTRGVSLRGLLSAVLALLVTGLAPTVHAQGDAPTLRVLALFPMTGPGASLGAYLEQGAVLAREDIEKRHDGRLKIDLQVIDSKGKAADAVTALQAAIAQQKPHAIITSLSPVSRAIKPIVEKEGILTFITLTTMQDIARGTGQMVRVYANASDFAAPLAAHAGKQYRKVQVIHLQDEFGQSMFEAFSTAMKGSNTTLSVATYDMMQKDTRALVSRVVDEKPDAVYVIGYGPAYIATIRFLRELAPQLPLLADSTFNDPANRAALGDLAEGTVASGTENELSQSTSAPAKAFREAFRLRHGRDAYAPAVFSYDAINIMADVSLRKGNVVTATKADVIRRSPIKGVLGDIRIDKDGESSFAMKLMKVQGGRNVAVP